jgi:AraC family transcriptional regulator
MTGSGPIEPIGPLEWRRRLPFDTDETNGHPSSDFLAAASYRAKPPVEFECPGLTHHMLVLYRRPPDQLELHSEPVKRQVPPPAGSIALFPAGSPARVRSSGFKDQLHVFLQPGLVTRAAEEAFELDPASVSVSAFHGLDLPQLRLSMLAVSAELASEAGGARLAAESLGNMLAVQLIRQILKPRAVVLRPPGALSRPRLRSVLEYIEEHLDSALTLASLASAANLSAFHFARQFKASVGATPHQYVIARRVQRAQQLLQFEGDLSLAQIAVSAGFSDQSHFSLHFKRAVGITPAQFRKSARIA